MRVAKWTSDGDRVSVVFNGLALGLFSGDLEFTAYKGSNLLRQEAVAKTDDAGCGLHLQSRPEGICDSPENTKLEWRDDARGLAAVRVGRRSE
jgi:hypothetical protein